MVTNHGKHGTFGKNGTWLKWYFSFILSFLTDNMIIVFGTGHF